MSNQAATRTESDARLPSRWTLLRDVLSFAGGWVLIFLEVLRPEVREPVLLLGMTAIGFPGLAVGATAVLDALAARRAGTGGSPSAPAEPGPSQSSSLPL